MKAVPANFNVLQFVSEDELTVRLKHPDGVTVSHPKSSIKDYDSLDSRVQIPQSQVVRMKDGSYHELNPRIVSSRP